MKEDKKNIVSSEAMTREEILGKVEMALLVCPPIQLVKETLPLSLLKELTKELTDELLDEVAELEEIEDDYYLAMADVDDEDLLDVCSPPTLINIEESINARLKDIERINKLTIKY